MMQAIPTLYGNLVSLKSTYNKLHLTAFSIN